MAFLGLLALLAARSVQDRLDEWARAALMREQLAANRAIGLAVHELQKERGISSGHLASGGGRFAETLAEQRVSTDPVLAMLRSVLPARLAADGGRHHAAQPVLAVLQDIPHLRLQVSALELDRDDAVERYTRMIAALFELMTDTARIADGHLLRSQLALIAFLQAKEMAGQERALITTLLAGRNFESRVHREALQRVRTEQEIYIRQFLGLADEAVREAYWDMLEAPAVQHADTVRRRIVHIAEAPLFGVETLPGAEQWFDVSTRKIDALKTFEDVLDRRVAQGAAVYEERAAGDLLMAVVLTLASLLLAAVVLVQIRRGQRKTEQDLHLAASVFGNCVEAIVITDAQAVIVEANQAFARISGYAVDEVVGKPMRLFKSERHERGFFARMWRDLVRHGSWEGEVWNRRKNGELYPAQLSVVAVRAPQGRVANYIAMIVDLSQRKRSEALIEQLRSSDPLTGLLSRDAWASTVEQAVAGAAAQGSLLAVLDLGLDRFKLINEALGHAVGDQVLIEAALRIRGALPHGSAVARLGGDRFGVLLTQDASRSATEETCASLLDAFKAPIQAGEHALNLSVSIGAARYPADAPDAPGLLMNAESAMNRVKDGGRAHYKLYEARMNLAGPRLLTLERMLRQALENGEFSLHYQPQVDACNGAMVGVEALLRWRNAELGTVSPVQFIPVAEETGLIVPIGAWALRTACLQARRWRDELGCDIPVAVNLSARQFAQTDLVRQVEAVLAESGLPGHLLELEITEGLLVEDPLGVAATLHALRALGVSLAIDDFGTGYSSLAYLKTFPLDRLKMDRSFVRDLQSSESDRAIAHAIVALARNLRIDVVAEGVETAAQRDFLAGAGCRVLQGYLFGRPAPADALAERVRAGELQAARSQPAA